MIQLDNARKYCFEDISLIENYGKAVADVENMWDCHHRVETIMHCGKKELIAQGCYYDRPAHELIFLKESEHIRLHHAGKHVSEATRAKLSAAGKGNTNFLGCHHTAETKAKMSEAKKGKHYSDEARAKMSESHKGKHHSEETLAKMSESHKGKKLSPETKARIAEARRLWWQKRGV